MSLLSTTILAAAEAGAEHAEEAEKSELPFFVLGAILVSFAAIVSVIGFKKPDFPGNAGAARGVMALGAGLVVATLFSVIYVSI